jgi:hypothetical protein
MSDPESQYNTVYERLVLRDDDLIGLIAYALYKQRKRAWLVDFKSQKSRAPRPDEQSSYIIGETTAARSNDYRQQAEASLGAYADQVIKSATPELQRAAIAGKIERSLAWYRQIPGGIVAAFSYTVLLISIVLVLKYSGIDLLGILNAAGPKN